MLQNTLYFSFQFSWAIRANFGQTTQFVSSLASWLLVLYLEAAFANTILGKPVWLSCLPVQLLHLCWSAATLLAGCFCTTPPPLLPLLEAHPRSSGFWELVTPRMEYEWARWQFDCQWLRPSALTQRHNRSYLYFWWMSAGRNTLFTSQAEGSWSDLKWATIWHFDRFGISVKCCGWFCFCWNWDCEDEMVQIS